MQKWFYIGLTIVFGLLILMMLINDSLEFIANIIVMIHSIVLYVPASYYAYKTFKKMEKWSETRWIFYYAFLMMIYSIISWIFIICNVLWDEITHILYGPFFYLSNLMLFIAVLSGYFGYIYPKWFRKIVEKRIGHKIDKE